MYLLSPHVHVFHCPEQLCFPTGRRLPKNNCACAYSARNIKSGETMCLLLWENNEDGVVKGELRTAATHLRRLSNFP